MVSIVTNEGLKCNGSKKGKFSSIPHGEGFLLSFSVGGSRPALSFGDGYRLQPVAAGGTVKDGPGLFRNAGA
jgi:hypothetical protein